jgi:hypothetical protein
LLRKERKKKHISFNARQNKNEVSHPLITISLRKQIVSQSENQQQTDRRRKREQNEKQKN